MYNLLVRARAFFITLMVLTAVIIVGAFFFPVTYEAGLLGGLATAVISFVFGVLVFLSLTTALLEEGKSLEDIQEMVARVISGNVGARYSMQSCAVFFLLTQIFLMVLISINWGIGPKPVAVIHGVLLVAVIMDSILFALALCFDWLFALCEQKVEERSLPEEDIVEETVQQEGETISSSTALVPTAGGLPAVPEQ